MSIALKAATLYGLPVAAGVALLEAATGAGLTGSPLVDGLIGGAGVTLVTVGIYKQKVDGLSRAVEQKADKETVAEMRDDIRDIRRHLMGDQ